MHIQSPSMAGRGFLIQFLDIMQEFGETIPWLRPASSLRYVTNGAHFNREFSRLLGCEPSSVVPYQLTTREEAHEYLGGLLHFRSSPEDFRDPGNREIMWQLEREGASYITCLQVRDVKRGQGYGTELVRKAMCTVQKTHVRVWAVCEQELSPWYEAAGATALNAPHNKDGLAIISW